LLLAGCGSSGKHSLAVTVSAVPPPLPTVVIYGDSLTVLAETDAVHMAQGRLHLVFRAYGGTSPCDWTAGAADDLRTLRPAHVVIAFTGNSASCVQEAYEHGGLAAVVDTYRRSLLRLADVYRGVPVTVVATPAMARRPAGTHTPINGNAAFNRMYRSLCGQLGWQFSTVADDALTPGHVFTWRRPAFPGTGPSTVVRAPDGVHLLPAGALYYAAALVTAGEP
jgi:hypothetical protein